MLQDAADIVKRVGVLLDDPSNSQFSQDYLMPWIDQHYDVMDGQLEAMGMQYVEGIAVIPLPPGTTDLSPYLMDGQPLATMKAPRRMKWKLTSQPDTMYLDSISTDELDEVPADSIGNNEYTFEDGALQVTPSGTATTIKIYYDQMSTNIFDPQGNVIRGTAHILALRVAADVADIKGMSIAKKRDDQAGKAFDDFAAFLSKQKQGARKLVPRIHSTVQAPTPSGYV